MEYFNQRLLNISQKSASDDDYIYFAHSVLHKMKIRNQINIAIGKVETTNSTAGMLRKNSKETVKDFIASDEVFSFMNTVKGLPGCFKKVSHKVFPMVKRLGLLTFFLTLSCADLGWN